MSSDLAPAPDHICYVHCNFCNMILAINNKFQDFGRDYGSSSKGNRMPLTNSLDDFHQQILPIRPPYHQKRQRAPSAYNRFIKEEIQRIKTNNPDISHREAFSAAAKNNEIPRSEVRRSLEKIQQSSRYLQWFLYSETIPSQWAHLPRIHFDLTLETNKQLKIDAPIAADRMGKAQAFY